MMITLELTKEEVSDLLHALRYHQNLEAKIKQPLFADWIKRVSLLKAKITGALILSKIKEKLADEG